MEILLWYGNTVLAEGSYVIVVATQIVKKSNMGPDEIK